MDKTTHYAVLIGSQIQEMFHDECENYIDPEDFKDEENFKAFLHALSTMVPNNIFNRWTGETKNNLEYNHVANQLVFEYSLPVSQNFESEEAEKSE